MYIVIDAANPQSGQVPGTARFGHYSAAQASADRRTQLSYANDDVNVIYTVGIA